MAHIVITGASSGLGEYLAVELGRRGHTLGLIARREPLLLEVGAKVVAAGGKATFATADVTDRDGLRKAIQDLVDAQGPVDILVANAGSGFPVSAAKLNSERVVSLMRLNYDGTVYAVEAVLPDMLARGSGQIVAVSSLAAWRGIPKHGPYSASKAALSVLMEAFDAELRPKGIAVTTIHPGFVKTPLTAKNRFYMPFLMDVEPAARLMADGILARKRRVDFPSGTLWLARILRALPGAVMERAAARMG